MQGVWVQSLVRELRSHMPWGVVKKKNKRHLWSCVTEVPGNTLALRKFQKTTWPSPAGRFLQNGSGPASSFVRSQGTSPLVTASALNRETAPPFAALRIQSPQLCTHRNRPSAQEQQGEFRARTKVYKIPPWCQTKVEKGMRGPGGWAWDGKISRSPWTQTLSGRNY